MILSPPHQELIKSPSLQAADIKDVPAEFIADPFIIHHNFTFYMFFEVLDKQSGKGMIGLATSKDGEKWEYEKIVLREEYHLSYPHVFMYNNNFYMIPESCEANKVLLYKAKNFPYDWKVSKELMKGKYVDTSIFQYNDKWWMFSGKNRKLHLFYSDHLEGNWKEHSKSPLITNNNNITRPGGRVIVENNEIFRYTQDGEPSYGSAVRVFKINHLSKTDYSEKEVDLILKGTKSDTDWRKDGMHSIDQIKINENEWLVVVDGHKLVKRNFILWKLERLFSKFFICLLFLMKSVILENLDFISF
jgi:hypothetical protein